MRIIMLCQETENTVVYFESDLNLVGTQTVKAWAEDCTDERIDDVFDIEQKELQYYCIDGRVWVNEAQERELYDKYGKK